MGDRKDAPPAGVASQPTFRWSMGSWSQLLHCPFDFQLLDGNLVIARIYRKAGHCSERDQFLLGDSLSLRSFPDSGERHGRASSGSPVARLFYATCTEPTLMGAPASGSCCQDSLHSTAKHSWMILTARQQIQHPKTAQNESSCYCS